MKTISNALLMNKHHQELFTMIKKFKLKSPYNLKLAKRKYLAIAQIRELERLSYSPVLNNFQIVENEQFDLVSKNWETTRKIKLLDSSNQMKVFILESLLQPTRAELNFYINLQQPYSLTAYCSVCGKEYITRKYTSIFNVMKEKQEIIHILKKLNLDMCEHYKEMKL